MKQKIVLLVFVLFICANLAFAATWKTFTVGNKSIQLDENNVYVFTDNTGFEFMSYLVRNKNSSGIYHLYMVSVCDEDKVGISKTYKVDSNGKVLSVKTPENKITTVKQGTPGAAVHNYVCSIYRANLKDLESYKEKAQNMLDSHNYIDALYYAQLAYSEGERLRTYGHSLYHLSSSKELSAQAYSGLGNLEMAEQDMREALELSQQFNDPQYTAMVQTKYDLMLGLLQQKQEEDAREAEEQARQLEEKKLQEQRLYEAQEEEKRRQHELQLKKIEARNQLINTGIDLIKQFTH